MNEEFYYNGNEMLTHNRLFNMAVGSRGKGKTHWGLSKGIDNFKKGKGEFIYLRRYKEEIKPLKLSNKLFDVIKNEYPNDELTVKGDLLFCNGVKCGYILALSVCSGKKSIAYPDVTWIVFDEFIIDKKSVYRYLVDDVQCFLEFFSTVNRDRNNCKVAFFSNNITITNPYFVYFKLYPNPSKRFFHKGELLIEYIPADDDFVDAMYSTRFGSIIKGTPYGAYAVENKAMRDNFDFIDKKQGTAHYYCTLKYNDINYGIWVDMNRGKFYVSYDIDEYYGHIFCLTLSDHSPNTLLITRKNTVLKVLSENFKMGNVFFESLRIKNESIGALQLLI